MKRLKKTIAYQLICYLIENKIQVLVLIIGITIFSMWLIPDIHEDDYNMNSGVLIALGLILFASAGVIIRHMIIEGKKQAKINNMANGMVYPQNQIDRFKDEEYLYSISESELMTRRTAEERFNYLTSFHGRAAVNLKVYNHNGELVRDCNAFDYFNKQPIINETKEDQPWTQ